MTRTEIINSTDNVVDTMVKIAGTNWDRRRVVTKSMRRRMLQMYGAGKSLSKIADHFDVSYDTVKRTVFDSYNESEKERKRALSKKYTVEYNPNRLVDRADYKRQLLKEHKSVIIS